MSTALALADQLYQGLYSSDCACQTEQDEIVELKATHDLLTHLHDEIAHLKSELAFARDSLQSSFYEELQAHGQTIYYQFTDKLDELRKNHSKALETLRLSYRSQLHDFISQARSIMNAEKAIPSPEIVPQQRALKQSQDQLSFFHQAAIKGYENEISNLKKEIEQIQDTTRYEIKLATNFLTDEKERLAKEVSIGNRNMTQMEGALARKDEQIRDLKRDLATAQTKLKQSKKVTMHEPTSRDSVVQHALSIETESWVASTAPILIPTERSPSPPPPASSLVPTPPTILRLPRSSSSPPPPASLLPSGSSLRANEKVKRTPVDVQQPIVPIKPEPVERTLPSANVHRHAPVSPAVHDKGPVVEALQPDVQHRPNRMKTDKLLITDEQHRHDIKRHAEKHKQEIQLWETKYEILRKSMLALREEMYTRQTHVRDRFMVKPAVVTYN